MAKQNIPQLFSQAIALHQAGKLAGAEEMYRNMLASEPRHPDILRLLGTVCLQSGRYEEGIALLRQSLAINPAQPEALVNLGLALQHMQRHQEAVATFDKAVALKSDYADAYKNRGDSLQKLQRYDEALASYDKALIYASGNAETYNNRGMNLREMKRYNEALASCDKAIALKPDYAVACNNRGIILQKMKRYDQALADYDKTLALQPNYAEAYNNRGVTLQEMKRHDEALVNYDKALALKPDHSEAFNNKGATLQEMKRHDEALASYDRALACKPDNAKAHYNRGRALHIMERDKEALLSCDRAIAFKPDYAEAYNQRGNVLRRLSRYNEALSSYNKAIELQTDYAEAYYNRAILFQQFRKYEDALASLEKVVTLKPALPYLWGNYAHAKMQLCDWQDMESVFDTLEKSIGNGEIGSPPLAILAAPLSATLQRKCAEIHVQDRFPPGAFPLRKGEKYNHDRIRIGYFSSDFRNHPLSYLMAGVFEHHDRAKFEVTAFSFGAASDEAMRARLENAFEHFIDVSGNSEREIAELVRQKEIDIAVDLNGFTQDSKTGIFAHRPAPVAVNYLGYPGTMGADYIDYIVGDAFVIPVENQIHYSEKIVYLPHCFQANDDKRFAPEEKPSRADYGLPEDAFVFCCFNNSYKITPEMFDSWMRLLKAVAGSVLWLIGDAAVQRNLAMEASNRGMDSSRLIFVEKIEYAQHLNRLPCADLFLDTLPFNAGTTASDALWAGLPVITCAGEAFASRMAGSLLNTMGLSELITADLAAYELLALELATHPQKLAEIRQKLVQNRSIFPLFDTRRFTGYFEQALIKIWERSQAGLPPEHIFVTE